MLIHLFINFPGEGTFNFSLFCAELKVVNDVREISLMHTLPANDMLQKYFRNGIRAIEIRRKMLNAEYCGRRVWNTLVYRSYLSVVWCHLNLFISSVIKDVGLFKHTGAWQINNIWNTH